MRSLRFVLAALALLSSLPIAAAAGQRGAPRRAAEIAIEDLQPLPAPPYPDPRLPSIDAARRLEDKCDVVLQWVDRINVEYTPPSPRGWATVSISRGFQLYRDEDFSQVFGRRFTETTPEWRRGMWEDVLAKCLELRKPSRFVGFSGQPSPEDVAQRLMAFRGALEGPFAGRGEQSTNETMRIQHQLRDQRRVLETDLSTLPNAPTLAVFQRLAEYAVNLTKELNALWPSERAYFEKAVMTRRTEIASRALAAWVAAPGGTTIADAVRLDREMRDYAPLLEVVPAAERDAVARRHTERIAAIVAPFIDARLARMRSMTEKLGTLSDLPKWKASLAMELGPLARGPAYDAALVEYRSTRERMLTSLLPVWRRVLDEAPLAGPEIDELRRRLDDIFPPDERNSATYTAYYTPYAALARRRDAAGAETRAEKCSDLDLDLTAGTLGGILPNASMDDLKDRFPCFTSEAPEYPGRSNLRAGLVFARHGMTFFTMRQYVEVRTGFRGAMSPSLLGVTASHVRRLIGSPDAIGRTRDGQVMLFERDYGCLATVADPAGRVAVVNVSHAECSEFAGHLGVRGLQWQ
jgi:hypothetical protein